MGRKFFLLILGLTLLAGCQTSTTIVNNVAEREANEIVVLLASQGIPAEKVSAPTATTGAASAQKLWDISVPSSQITEALSILNQAGLPRIKGTKLLDLFGAQGLVPSDLQDRIRYQEGLSEQLATTIRKMDGIIDANVQITFPKDEEETPKPLTASVYVKHRGNLDNPNSLMITKIKRLVSSAIPGLTIENVSVIADRALYADISLDPSQQFEEEGGIVSIWGVNLTKDSAPKFRFIFYTFIILLFLLTCLLVWIIWKFLPTLQKNGVKTLFYPEQYSAGEVIKKVKEENEEGSEE